ncbi:MAG: ABC transporter ATP-binding protein [Anaerolineaceae bacterium]|nr:ABC transporter ATP-binding protein [Anaerolineaceae bacterium]
MNNILEIHDLNVTVRGDEILNKINIEVPEGEVHAIFGPNGSGKTSLMMTIMGFSDYKITSGKIIFEGEDITELGLTERARKGIAVAQQRPPTIKGVRLRQVLDYAYAQNAANARELEDLITANGMDKFLDRDINDGLSGGEIRRVELLQLLATRPKFAMLDEPDSGVDIEALELIGEMAKRLFSIDISHPAFRRSGLIITHTGQILENVYADKAHVMLDGTIEGCGNAQIVLDTIYDSGYSQCLTCIKRKVNQ